SYLSWHRFFAAEPNIGHLTLAQWQRAGRLAGCVTQNVDRLHQKASTESVIELHGSLYQVRCTGCHRRTLRLLFQQALAQANRELLQEWSATVASITGQNYHQIVRP